MFYEEEGTLNRHLTTDGVLTSCLHFVTEVKESGWQLVIAGT